MNGIIFKHNKFYRTLIDFKYDRNNKKGVNYYFFHRSHQKFIVIDNDLFIGSSNIAEEYSGFQYGTGEFIDMNLYVKNAADKEKILGLINFYIDDNYIDSIKYSNISKAVKIKEELYKILKIEDKKFHYLKFLEDEENDNRNFEEDVNKNEINDVTTKNNEDNKNSNSSNIDDANPTNNKFSSMNYMNENDFLNSDTEDYYNQVQKDDENPKIIKNENKEFKSNIFKQINKNIVYDSKNEGTYAEDNIQENNVSPMAKFIKETFFTHKNKLGYFFNYGFMLKSLFLKSNYMNNILEYINSKNANKNSTHNYDSEKISNFYINNNELPYQTLIKKEKLNFNNLKQIYDFSEPQIYENTLLEYDGFKYKIEKRFSNLISKIRNNYKRDIKLFDFDFLDTRSENFMIENPFNEAENQDRIVQMIKEAKKEIVIVQPYYLRLREIDYYLIDAKRRGVDVTIVTAGKRDQPCYRPLINKKLMNHFIYENMNVYEYMYNYLHMKFYLVDGKYLSIGSFNNDKTSAIMNNEANYYMTKNHTNYKAFNKLNNYIVDILSKSRNIEKNVIDFKKVSISDNWIWTFFIYGMEKGEAIRYRHNLKKYEGFY